MSADDAAGDEIGTVTFPVERGKIREFARAVLSSQPEELDGEVAPPTFLQTAAFWEPKHGPRLPNLGFDFLRLLHGEQSFEYLAPIRAGDELTCTSRVSDRYERPSSRGGVNRFAVMENTFTNQDGTRVAIARMTIVEPAKRD